MKYQFWGWQNVNVKPVTEEYKGINSPIDLYNALSTIWCADTCAPRMRADWTRENKTLGQCSITAFLAQDIFGGKVYGVLRPGGNYHCFNVIGDCRFDLTSEQFGDEVLDYENNPEQFREVHFAKEEKRLRYEYLKAELENYCMAFDFDREINRFNTHSLKWDFCGKEQLPLWVADSDFLVPPAVTKRLKDRIEHGLYGYYLEGNEIYDVLMNWFLEEYNVTIPKKDWIKLVPAIVPSLAVASNIGGGKSIVCTPNYCGLLGAPLSAGNELIKVPLKNENEHYSMDFDALEAAITEDTKIFYLCNPHNPVGRVYSMEELKQVSAFAKKHHLLVVSDEVHCEIIFEGKHIPFFTVDDYAREHSITLYSNGKMYNVPDLILAFAVIPNQELRKEFERLGYAFGEEHVLNVEAGIATYAESGEWRKQLLVYLKNNRDYLEQQLKMRFPKAKVVHLEGTYLEWVDFRAYGNDVDAGFFKRKAKVFLSEGEIFGSDGYVRINFATRRKILEEALDRMERALSLSVAQA